MKKNLLLILVVLIAGVLEARMLKIVNPAAPQKPGLWLKPLGQPISTVLISKLIDEQGNQKSLWVEDLKTRKRLGTQACVPQYDTGYELQFAPQDKIFSNFQCQGCCITLPQNETFLGSVREDLEWRTNVMVPVTDVPAPGYSVTIINEKPYKLIVETINYGYHGTHYGDRNEWIQYQLFDKVKEQTFDIPAGSQDVEIKVQ